MKKYNGQQKKRKLVAGNIYKTKQWNTIEYKRHRAIVRKMAQRQRRDDWDKFVKTLERDITGTQRDITGTQRRGFKIFKQLQLQGKR